MSSGDHGEKTNLYTYVPSLGGGLAAAIIFALLAGGHLLRMVKSRMWFMTAFVVGGVFEFAGYVARILGHYQPTQLSGYIVETLLILVAPSLFAATIYMVLGRVIRATHAEKHAIVRPTRLTKIFVTGDVLCFFIQGGGGGITGAADSDDHDKIKLGQNIILGGLFLQVLLFGVFVLTALMFHFRLRKSPTPESHQSNIHWQNMLVCLYIVSALVMLRNIFRIIEYIEGREGYFLTHEWTAYVFDMALMSLAMLVFLVIYPTRICPKEVYPLDHLESHPVTMKSPSSPPEYGSHAPRY